MFGNACGATFLASATLESGFETKEKCLGQRGGRCRRCSLTWFNGQRMECTGPACARSAPKWGISWRRFFFTTRPSCRRLRGQALEREAGGKSPSTKQIRKTEFQISKEFQLFPIRPVFPRAEMAF